MVRPVNIYHVAVFTAAVALASAAQAQGKASQADKETRARAREAYNRGQELFQSGNYQEADVAFQEAFEAVPNPVVLLSIGECQKRKGENQEAVGTLERYLELKPDAADRESVEAKIQEIKSLPATLTVISDPSGAAIRIDGEDSGKVTPTEIEIAPGEHSVELSLKSGESVTKTVTAGYGTKHELRVEIGAEALVDPFAAKGSDIYQPPAEEPDDSDDSEPSPSLAPWIVMSVGGAALVAGSVLGVMVLSEESDFNEKPSVDTADRGEKLALFADVAFGVGAVAVVTGVVLLLTEGEPASEDPDAEASAGKRWQVRVAPALLKRGGGVQASVQF